MEQAAFLILMLSGVVVLVCSAVWTRLNWRSDGAPYGRNTPFFDVLLHPARYANDSALPAIRWLNIAGAFSILSALAILAHKVFVDLSSSTP